MKIKDIKKQLRIEGKSFVPGNKNLILQMVGAKSKKYKFKFNLKPIIVFASIVLIFVLSTFLFNHSPNIPKTLNTIIVIEINPKIELEIIDDEVKSIRPLNADGSLLLQDYTENLINNNYQDTVCKIIELSQEIGYFNSENNNSQINLIVINDDQNIENNVVVSLESEIKQNFNIDVNYNKGGQNLVNGAKKYSISIGRMVLINEALQNNSNGDYLVNDLLEYSVQELNDVINYAEQNKIQQVKKNYNASINAFNNKKIEAINKLEKYQQNILKEIYNIKTSVNNNEPIAIIVREINLLLAKIGIEINEKINRNNVLEVLDRIKDQFNQDIDYHKILIEEKYEEQVKAFKFQYRNEIKNEDFKSNFKFDEDFEIKIPKYQGREKDAYLLITKIITKIRVLEKNNNNQSHFIEQIQALYSNFEYLVNNKEISNDFLESEEIKNFQSIYQQFINQYLKNK